MTAFNIVSRLLYRDALMLVLDKPAGLAVHGDRRGGETLGDHLDDLRFGLPRRPEIVHRLDRGTSGCLVLGRHPRALARLNAAFAGRTVEKVYWALVAGGPEEDAGEIDLALASEDPRTGWRMKVDPAGQAALTHWAVLGRGAGCAWLELRPLTGRTHQLRVHCAAAGWPILGDALYGVREAGLMLHARGPRLMRLGRAGARGRGSALTGAAHGVQQSDRRDDAPIRPGSRAFTGQGVSEGAAWGGTGRVR